MKNNLVTWALPKGRLGEGALEVLRQAGFPTNGVATASRQLAFGFPEKNIQYLICRPTDIPTYVEYGAADLGIVGKDTLVEADADVFELLDLGFGRCRFVVAAPFQDWQRVGQSLETLISNSQRVATKFPRVAKEYFQGQGIPIEIIKLHGNIELAPRVGLADLIVDIVSTGQTLRENNLVAVTDIFESTARLIANRVSYRIDYRRLASTVEALRQVINPGGWIDVSHT